MPDGWRSNPDINNLSENNYITEPDYQTVKISLDEIDLQQYIWEKRGWKLVTQFRIGDDSTLLCTFRKE